ncbi:BspA family leucine-rich repeat surface protein [Lactobacillus sp. ESL0791]|uniref:BspA family leucine-rich repeat surface protein n=1 Tax=Lactobacillus sp. ESL0791 TaxID=2983234 RepID=UPI0023F714CA|nr:BspA family leucine-rich repeat surface protein [Lactobacillus sp. ESL0791]MDF7639640.1 BspA family leucine-rich repeat surface protein [Lactobacillus sp. ESL0791]
MKKATNFRKNNRIISLTLIALLGISGFVVNTAAVHADTTTASDNTFSALWTGKDGDCTWSYDIITRTLTISSSAAGQQLGTKTISGLIPWYRTIEHIDFATPVSLAINSGSKFSSLDNLKTIDHFDRVDTSRVVNMAELFSGNRNLTTIDLSKINTAKVANMTNMFAGDEKLTGVDLHNLDTSHVAKKNGMFTGTNLSTSTNTVEKSQPGGATAKPNK